MANSSVYQSKRKRLMFENEAAVGTADVLDADSFYVPAFDVSISRDRGTQVIARDGVMDGFAGEMCGAIGSQGSSMAFSCELHPIDTVVDPYFVRLLQGCGWEGTDTGTSIIMYPSAAPIVGYTAVEPSSLTIGWVHRNDTIPDTLQSMTGSTGAANFVFNSGKRAQLDFSFVGLQDQYITTGSFSTFGANTFTGVACSPFIVKGVLATMTDAGGKTIDVVSLADFSMNTNAQTPDVLDPTSASGFGVSPVLFDSSPTVSFTVAATDNNNKVFWQNFSKGTTIAISITMTDAATGNSIALNLDQVQSTKLDMSPRNGLESYSVEGKVVRTPGESYQDPGSFCQFVWTY